VDETMIGPRHQVKMALLLALRYHCSGYQKQIFALGL